MKKILYLFFISFLLLIFTSCNNSNNNLQNDLEEDEMNKTLQLIIGDVEVEVSWLDNDSVNELIQYVNDTLDIKLHQHGGFEQYGSIGKTLTSNDKRIKTNPGDIVLYSSNQIVLFYGSNTWSYTKLGKMNLKENELYELLGKEDSITITLKVINI